MARRARSKPEMRPSPLVGEGREGGAGASLSRLGPSPPSPSLPHKGREGRSAQPVLLGEFGRAHGLKGEVRLKSFTEDPKAIARYTPLQSEDGRSFTLKNVRPAGGGSPDLVIVRVDGIATREAAETLNRIRLYAPRERLHGTEREDEFLLADLIGLAAVDQGGAVLGTVIAVPNYGGGDLLEVAPHGGGPTGLLPFTESFVPLVDIAASQVVIDPPEGFFDGASPFPSRKGERG